VAGVRRLADAELAVGRPVSLAPNLAADSVSDLLELFSILPRIDDFPALSQLRGHGQTLHFHATDPGLATAGEWLAHRTPAGSSGSTDTPPPTPPCVVPRWTSCWS
jgi:hypothetical protein